MQDNLTTLDNCSINSKNLQAVMKKPLSITFLRTTVCIAVLTTILILKITNPDLFYEVCNWCKINLLCESTKVKMASEHLKRLFASPETFVPKVQAFLKDFKF